MFVNYWSFTQINRYNREITGNYPILILETGWRELVVCTFYLSTIGY